MPTALFLAFVVIMTAVITALTARYIGRKAAFRLLGGLSVWFIYVGLLAYSGLLKNTTIRPPGIAFLLIPVVVFLVYFLIRPWANARVVLAFPLWIILGLQSFRIFVELFLHQLWIDGLVPKMLTFEGANLDIYTGISAPLIAWLSVRWRYGVKLSLIWNILGLLVLANVVVRAILTAPGPLNFIHSEIQNRMIGTFPYTFIPAFFVPLAVVLHVLAIQKAIFRIAARSLL